MIGVVAGAGERAAVDEFFELFKTPWEPWRPDRYYDVVIAATDVVPEVDTRLLLVFRSRPTSVDARLGIVAGAALRDATLQLPDGAVPIYGDAVVLTANAGVPRVAVGQGCVGQSFELNDRRLIRLGYDLFGEIRHLLETGQPVQWAGTATADRHVDLVRTLILEAGIEVVEIPPVPAGYPFIACLTHDIDFFGIRRHRLDPTMWGFLYRATLGALVEFGRRRIPISRLARSLGSAASLPFVYLGWARDFWLPFEWYLQVERGLPATYFVIPFKHRAGSRPSGDRWQRRACAYDVDDLGDWPVRLRREGCEVALHGIDAWHDPSLGALERRRVAAVAGEGAVGVRMHWLMGDSRTPRVLEEGGFAYDATAGYNETPGYRHGTSQVFRPPGCRTLLELPLHIQDGALFLAKRLYLSESTAWELCEQLASHARTRGGVLTVLWHDRSHAAERFWGDFYVRLVQRLKALGAWFATAAQAVEWFRRRREVVFVWHEGGNLVLEPLGGGGAIVPSLTVRIHRPGNRDRSTGARSATPPVDCAWDGSAKFELGSSPLASAARGKLEENQKR